MKISANTLDLKIAGFSIRLVFHKTQSPHTRSLFIKQIRNYFSGFVIHSVNQQKDFSINFIEHNTFEMFILNDKKSYFINFYKISGKYKIISYYHIGMNQLQFILRDILQKLMTKSNAFMLHTSAVIIKNKAFLFMGPSEAGKSTVIKLLKSEFKVIADDSIIIKKVNKNYYAYQTPFKEKEWWIKKGLQKYHIGRIFFLKKADNFRIVKINKVKIIKRIINQFLTSNMIEGKEQMKYIFAFTSRVDFFYELSFRKEKNGLVQLMNDILHSKSI